MKNIFIFEISVRRKMLRVSPATQKYLYLDRLGIFLKFSPTPCNIYSSQTVMQLLVDRNVKLVNISSLFTNNLY